MYMYTCMQWINACLFCYFKFYTCTWGRYDVLLPNVECLDCEKDISPKIEDLISRGFWPGSPRIHDGNLTLCLNLIRMHFHMT